MDVQECLRSRRTVRWFKDEPVPDEVVEKILNAARWAPSSRNQQPWRLIVVKDSEMLARIGDIAGTGAFIGAAPLAVAIVMDDADSPELDAGRALQQMELMAWAVGLGTCFVTFTQTERQEIAELLEIPQGKSLITVLPFGFRRDDFKGRGVPRRPLAEIAYAERFGVAYSPG